MPDDALERLSLPELLQRFWDVVMEQRGEHRGGHTWVGTGGTSAFGHSGADREGIRVHGDSLHGSALKVIESRRYVDYATSATLRAENLRQVLAALKHMAPAGPLTELDVDETIDRSCRNGGEIELVFKRELRDRIQVIVLMDNGGASMRPYLDLVKLVFGLMRDHFKDLDYYYFHNCVYGCVYSDPKRLTPYLSNHYRRRQHGSGRAHALQWCHGLFFQDQSAGARLAVADPKSLHSQCLAQPHPPIKVAPRKPDN